MKKKKVIINKNNKETEKIDYYKASAKLEEKLLNACDSRLQALDEMGWNDSSMDIDTITNDAFKEAAKWLTRNGYEAVNEMMDCMEDALELDVGIPVEKAVNPVRVERIWSDGYQVPVIHLVARPSITHPTIFGVDITPDENGGEAWVILSDKVSAKCLDSLDGARQRRLTTLPVNEHLTDEENQARFDELYASGDYDIDITIDWNGAIGYRPYVN